MANHNGNIWSTGAGGGSRKGEVLRNNKGYYNLAFIETFNDMSERDVELRKEYGKDLVSSYHTVHEKVIRLQKKSSDERTFTHDEVYYVKVGNVSVGKLSIRVVHLFKERKITFIYKERSYLSKNPLGAIPRKNTTNMTTKQKKRRYTKNISRGKEY